MVANAVIIPHSRLHLKIVVYTPITHQQINTLSNIIREADEVSKQPGRRIHQLLAIAATKL